jgi:hypothetical protein
MQFALERWHSWPSPLTQGDTPESGSGCPATEVGAKPPELRQIDPLLRRRLSPLARHSLHVAFESADNHKELPLVFASRHGDLARSVSLLEQLARDESPSPAAFSLSVHNSSTGVYSISRHDTSPSTALAAGEESLLWAWCEACLRLQDAERVLLVYVDEMMPPEYAHFGSLQGMPHAFSALIARGDALQISWQANTNHPPSEHPLSLAILSWLREEIHDLQWHGTRLSLFANRHDRSH